MSEDRGLRLGELLLASLEEAAEVAADVCADVRVEDLLPALLSVEGERKDRLLLLSLRSVLPLPGCREDLDFLSSLESLL